MSDKKPEFDLPEPTDRSNPQTVFNELKKAKFSYEYKSGGNPEFNTVIPLADNKMTFPEIQRDIISNINILKSANKSTHEGAKIKLNNYGVIDTDFPYKPELPWYSDIATLLGLRHHMPYLYAYLVYVFNNRIKDTSLSSNYITPKAYYELAKKIFNEIKSGDTNSDTFLKRFVPILLKQSKIETTHDDKVVTDLMSETTNKIYGFTGGPSNLCWFYSSLQLLLNTHAYRELIKKPVSTKKTKCGYLHHLFKQFIDKQENYPIKIDDRAIDVAGFILAITTPPIAENLKFGFYNHLTTGEQQDPSYTLDEVSECLNTNTFQVNYKTIYYDETTKTLTYLPLLENLTLGAVLANNSSSVPKASFVFSSTPLIKHRSTEFTSLQQLIDIIPVFQIIQKGNTTNDQKFISSLKSSSLSRYDEFKQIIEELSVKPRFDGKKKSFNIDDISVSWRRF